MFFVWISFVYFVVNSRAAPYCHWVRRNFIDLHQCFQALRNKPCDQCSYRHAKLADANLKRWFDRVLFPGYRYLLLGLLEVSLTIEGVEIITGTPSKPGKLVKVVGYFGVGLTIFLS